MKPNTLAQTQTRNKSSPIKFVCLFKFTWEMRQPNQLLEINFLVLELGYHWSRRHGLSIG